MKDFFQILIKRPHITKLAVLFATLVTMGIQLLAKDRMFKNKDYPTPFSAMVIYGFVFITCLQILGILKKEKSIILTLSVAILGCILYVAEGIKIIQTYKNVHQKGYPLTLGSSCIVTSVVFVIDAILFWLENKNSFAILSKIRLRNLFKKPSFFKIPCVIFGLVTILVQRFGNKGEEVWFGNPPSASFGYMAIYGFLLMALLQILMILANDKSPFMTVTMTSLGCIFYAAVAINLLVQVVRFENNGSSQVLNIFENVVNWTNGVLQSFLGSDLKLNEVVDTIYDVSKLKRSLTPEKGFATMCIFTSVSYLIDVVMSWLHIYA